MAPDTRPNADRASSERTRLLTVSRCSPVSSNPDREGTSVEKKKHPVQADGRDEPIHGDGVSEVQTPASAGESGGGAYPNPHDSKRSRNRIGSFFGRGGQSDPEYSGPDQKWTK